MASILGLGGSLTGKAATLKPLTDSSFVRRSRSRNKRPASVVAWFKDRARAKRERRAASPFASAYAKANVR